MKKTSGFTIVELLIVIVNIGKKALPVRATLSEHYDGTMVLRAHVK